MIDYIFASNKQPEAPDSYQRTSNAAGLDVYSATPGRRFAERSAACGSGHER
jgi:hypothetical protein